MKQNSSYIKDITFLNIYAKTLMKPSFSFKLADETKIVIYEKQAISLLQLCAGRPIKTCYKRLLPVSRIQLKDIYCPFLGSVKQDHYLFIRFLYSDNFCLTLLPTPLPIPSCPMWGRICPPPLRVSKRLFFVRYSDF